MHSQTVQIYASTREYKFNGQPTEKSLRNDGSKTFQHTSFFFSSLQCVPFNNMWSLGRATALVFVILQVVVAAMFTLGAQLVLF